MSVFLLKEPVCLFVHIPKCGGTTIREGLWNGQYDGPFRRTLPEDYERYPSFGFVRHPLTRFYSAFSDFVQNREFGGTLWDFAAIAMTHKPQQWWSPRTEEDHIWEHTTPQTNRKNRLYAAKWVCRYENFRNHLEEVLERMGVDTEGMPLPHLRASEHGDWRDAITPHLTEHLVDFYKEDFKRLDYAFPVHRHH